MTTTAPAEPAYELDVADLHRWLDEHVRKPADIQPTQGADLNLLEELR